MRINGFKVKQNLMDKKPTNLEMADAMFRDALAVIRFRLSEKFPLLSSDEIEKKVGECLNELREREK